MHEAQQAISRVWVVDAKGNLAQRAKDGEKILLRLIVASIILASISYYFETNKKQNHATARTGKIVSATP